MYAALAAIPVRFQHHPLPVHSGVLHVLAG
jgi:hypothetical protein